MGNEFAYVYFGNGEKPFAVDYYSDGVKGLSPKEANDILEDIPANKRSSVARIEVNKTDVDSGEVKMEYLKAQASKLRPCIKKLPAVRYATARAYFDDESFKEVRYGSDGRKNLFPGEADDILKGISFSDRKRATHIEVDKADGGIYQISYVEEEASKVCKEKTSGVKYEKRVSLVSGAVKIPDDRSITISSEKASAHFFVPKGLLSGLLCELIEADVPKMFREGSNDTYISKIISLKFDKIVKIENENKPQLTIKMDPRKASEAIEKGRFVLGLISTDQKKWRLVSGTLDAKRNSYSIDIESTENISVVIIVI